MMIVPSQSHTYADLGDCSQEVATGGKRGRDRCPSDGSGCGRERRPSSVDKRARDALSSQGKRCWLIAPSSSMPSECLFTMPPPSLVVDGHLLVQRVQRMKVWKFGLDESARGEEAQELAQEQRRLFLDLDTTEREIEGTPDENRGHQKQG